MKKKSALPFAAVLAIAAAWTLMNRNGPQPFRVNTEPFQRSIATQTTVSVQASSGDEGREQKIASLIQNDDVLSKFIRFHAVECDVSACTLQVSAKGDADSFRGAVEKLTRENPWLGPVETRNDKAASGVVTLVFQSPESLLSD